jgi:chorismate synthase
VQEIEATVDVESVTLEDIEANIARCPDAETAQKMIDRIDDIRKRGDSVGGTCGLTS